MVEERAEQLVQSGKAKPSVVAHHGLEATVIGSLIDLRAGDAISSQGSFAARMFAGESLGLYFAELYGLRAEYLAFAPEAANLTIQILPRAQTVAEQMNIAAGYALAQKRSQRRKVVVVLLPESSNALGYWHEAADVAVGERLPMIFVTTSRTPQIGMGNNVARQRAEAYGMPGIAVDGGDVVAMWRVAQESIHRARAGAGPTLIDSHIPAAQEKGGDPLDRMQHYLDKRKLWKQAWRGDLVQKFAAEIDEAQAFLAGPRKRNN
jgi:TPP-dependent pyruvate/acetoin dehydrogenase alpha subunit